MPLNLTLTYPRPPFPLRTYVPDAGTRLLDKQLGLDYVCALIEPSENLRHGDLPTLHVEFYAFSGGYVTQYYDEKYSFSEASRVPVTDGSATPGIDAAMQAGETPAKPVNTEPPAVSGTAAVGAISSCTTGSWSGSPSPKLTYTGETTKRTVVVAEGASLKTKDVTIARPAKSRHEREL